MIAFIQSHVLAIGIPLALVAGIGAALKVLPSLLEAKAMAALDFLFSKGDPAFDKWLCDTIQFAESEYGPATGAVKAAFVVDKVTSLLPIQYQVFMTAAVKAKAVALFQQSFDRLEATVLKEAKDHAPIIVPPAPPIVPPADNVVK
jgi:uncharacterized membrane protein YbaN (DUF454 family)